jgi:predicted nuclease of restriction endonuclease-like (RecB) superfamily
MASLPWGHNTILIETISDPATRLWYARKAIEHGWSRNMLAHWIDSDLHARQGKAVTNFKTTLPPAQSDLALQILKDPYNFDFLTLHHDAKEKDLETGLLEHITRFLIELGEGFAFVGRQMRFEVDGDDFSIDLLFYHLRLHAYLVVDLKTRKFEPEDAGKMSFYLSTVDDQMRTPVGGPTLGLVLCRTHSKVIAEYALRHIQRPVGVAGYKVMLTDKLPKALAGSLPSVEGNRARIVEGGEAVSCQTSRIAWHACIYGAISTFIPAASHALIPPAISLTFSKPFFRSMLAAIDER